MPELRIIVASFHSLSLEFKTLVAATNRIAQFPPSARIIYTLLNSLLSTIKIYCCSVQNLIPSQVHLKFEMYMRLYGCFSCLDRSFLRHWNINLKTACAYQYLKIDHAMIFHIRSCFAAAVLMMLLYNSCLRIHRLSNACWMMSMMNWLQFGRANKDTFV